MKKVIFIVSLLAIMLFVVSCSPAEDVPADEMLDDDEFLYGDEEVYEDEDSALVGEAHRRRARERSPASRTSRRETVRCLSPMIFRADKNFDRYEELGWRTFPATYLPLVSRRCHRADGTIECRYGRAVIDSNSGEEIGHFVSEYLTKNCLHALPAGEDSCSCFK